MRVSLCSLLAEPQLKVDICMPVMLCGVSQPSRCADLCRRSLSHEEALIVGEALKDRQSTAKQVQIVLDVAKDVSEC